MPYAGGVAAIIYRSEVRYTADIDFLLGGESDLKELAVSIIKDVGLEARFRTLAQPSQAPSMQKRRSPLALVLGRAGEGKKAQGLDFLMPVFPWAENALRRSKENVLSFGGYSAPFLTAEDIILAKIPAITQATRWSKDWDDILNIVQSGRPLDLAYLGAEIERLGLFVSPILAKELPKAVAVAMRHARAKRTS